MALPEIFDKLRLPVIGSPLFIVSGPDLVIAQCKAGIVGSFPALNARPQTLLDEWLHRITEELSAWNRENPDKPAAPFAVNQIVHKSNDRLEADLQTCAKWQVPIVITSLGAREDLNTAVHGWGGITLHDVINDRFAHKAIEKGADGLIPVASGAGGHAGTQSPFALMAEIREWFDGPRRSFRRHCSRTIHSRRPGDGRRSRIYRQRVHRDDRGQCRSGLQGRYRRGTSVRHRLFQPVHRRARQLPAPVDRGGGA